MYQSISDGNSRWVFLQYAPSTFRFVSLTARRCEIQVGKGEISPPKQVLCRIATSTVQYTNESWNIRCVVNVQRYPSTHSVVSQDLGYLSDRHTTTTNSIAQISHTTSGKSNPPMTLSMLSAGANRNLTRTVGTIARAHRWTHLQFAKDSQQPRSLNKLWCMLAWLRPKPNRKNLERFHCQEKGQGN